MAKCRKRNRRASPDDLRETVKRAIQLHQRKQLDRAEAAYRKVLKLVPDNVDALHFLGVLMHQRGQSELALDLIRRALGIDPGYTDAHNNLGNVLKELGRLDEAADAYRRVNTLDPRHAGAHNNLGVVYREQKRFSEALDQFQRSLELQPHNADTYVNLGNTLKEADREEEALTAFRKAIEIKPMHGEAHLRLGLALYYFHRIDEAGVVFRKWHQRDPENPIAEHMVAACTGSNVPDRASDAYIEATFDGFAGTFNEVLKRLDYQAPQLIFSAVREEFPPPARDLEVLDAGCGTGLCGPLLRPYARRLVGVDLSSAMLEKARGTGAYDDLKTDELTRYLFAVTGQFDLIVAADTFVYFGGLDEVFQAAAGALCPGGRLVFSVEHASTDEGVVDFRLNPHGRDSHTRDSIERTARAAGLAVRGIVPAQLRKEARQPVDGLIVTARRPHLANRSQT